MQIKVQAIRTGYYNHIRQREKTKFMADTNLFIKKEKVLKPEGKVFIKVGKDELLVPTWMKVIDPKFAKKELPEPEMENEDQEESEETSGAEDQDII